MGKGQRGCKEVWGGMSRRGGLENRGRPKAEEKGLGMRKAPRERRESMTMVQQANNSECVNEGQPVIPWCRGV